MTLTSYLISIAAIALLVFFPSATIAWLFTPDVSVMIVAMISLMASVVTTSATVLVTGRHKK